MWHQIAISTTISLEKIEALEKLAIFMPFVQKHALEVGRLEKDPEKFEAIYQEGLEQMRNEMDHLKTFLETTKTCSVEHVLLVIHLSSLTAFFDF